MEIKKLVNYYTDENTYIVYDENTKNGLVIDPGCDYNNILKSANEDNVKIKYVLITHCHYDHISDLEPLRAATGALLVSGDKGSINVTDPDINLTYSGLGKEISAKRSDIVLKDGEELDMDGIKIKCIYTPGHTNCGVCYLMGDHIFVGDTLFLRNCGRWDLPTGDETTLRRSIKEKLYTLPEDIIVHCGHGGDTSIGYEKKFNFYVKG